MTVDGYYASVKKLGLTKTSILSIYRDGDGFCYCVPDPKEMTSAQMLETLERLRRNLGLFVEGT